MRRPSNFPNVAQNDKDATPPGFRNTLYAVQVSKDVTPPGLRRLVEIPLGLLIGVVLAGLTLFMLDITVRKDLFVAASVVGITLASNLAVGFVVGSILAYVLRSDRFKV